MKTLLTAAALATVFPATAQAQATPEAAPKMECCCKNQDKPMDCCARHGDHKTAEHDHAGHNMSQHQQH